MWQKLNLWKLKLPKPSISNWIYSSANEFRLADLEVKKVMSQPTRFPQVFPTLPWVTAIPHLLAARPQLWGCRVLMSSDTFSTRHKWHWSMAQFHLSKSGYNSGRKLVWRDEALPEAVTHLSITLLVDTWPQWTIPRPPGCHLLLPFPSFSLCMFIIQASYIRTCHMRFYCIVSSVCFAALFSPLALPISPPCPLRPFPFQSINTHTWFCVSI